MIVLLPLQLSAEPPRVAKDAPANQECVAQTAQRVAIWSKEGLDRETIDKRVQAEMAKCSGVPDPCAAMVGAGNADLAWLGHAVLSGSMTPAEYLAGVRDRTRKMREFHKTPSTCAAYARGDIHPANDADERPQLGDRLVAATIAPTPAMNVPAWKSNRSYSW